MAEVADVTPVPGFGGLSGPVFGEAGGDALLEVLGGCCVPGVGGCGLPDAVSTARLRNENEGDANEVMTAKPMAGAAHR